VARKWFIVTDSPARPVRSHRRRWLVVGALVAVALFAYFSSPILDYVISKVSTKGEYRYLKIQIEPHLLSVISSLKAGMSPARHLSGPDRTRAEVAMAVNTALANGAFFREPDGRHQQLRAIADRFERTNGAELATEEGCLRLVAELEAKFPDAHDYAWFEMLRQHQDEGWIPRLSAASAPAR
jgi:hypothetical protein